MKEWTKKIADMEMFETIRIDDILTVVRVPGGIVLNQDTYRVAGNVPGTTRKFLYNFSSTFVPIDDKVFIPEVMENGK
jgi:hypothetical protein